MTTTFTNRLARESSPYLRQHGHNPVGWYPWGEEALLRARIEDRPIFLSIGYAACHWCHVMERESFEDPAVARLVNDYFVPIKVDREERPDLDAVYMAAVQAMTGSGGWPLSVFLTPDCRPFFGGTYFPPQRRWGTPAFSEVLLAVANAWQERRREVLASAAGIAAQLATASERPTRCGLDADDAVHRALETLSARFDADWGGFGGAPKFPTPSRLFFLLHRAYANAQARDMLARTLDAMACGGMHDWLGGGFHRYSVDEQWLVPHFEKMLYDNALLARLYGEAGLRLDNPAWVAVARATADYLLREMRGAEGGFFSSTDADSGGREGAYFVWTVAQVREALPREQAEVLIALCRLGEAGNFEGDSTVLRPQRSMDEIASELRREPSAVAEDVAAARATLLRARELRERPATDDKRLAGWNGMTVWALAYLGAALAEPRYLDAARAAARFLLERRSAEGKVVRSWRDGAESGAETLEDVAWVAAGLIELFQADANTTWLDAARALVAARLPRYQGSEGELLETPNDGPPLLMRPRSPFDSAIPSSVGVMAHALLDLVALLDDEGLRAAAERAVTAESAILARAPEACTTLLEAAVALAQPPQTLVVVGDPQWDSTRRLLAAAWCNRPDFCPLALSPSVPVPAETVGVVPLFAGRERAPGGNALAYLCRGGTCERPTSDPERLAASLRSVSDRSGEEPPTSG